MADRVSILDECSLQTRIHTQDHSWKCLMLLSLQGIATLYATYSNTGGQNTKIIWTKYRICNTRRKYLTNYHISNKILGTIHMQWEWHFMKNYSREKISDKAHHGKIWHHLTHIAYINIVIVDDLNIYNADFACINIEILK